MSLFVRSPPTFLKQESWPVACGTRKQTLSLRIRWIFKIRDTDGPKRKVSDTIWGYSKFWFTKIYYNFIIAMFFDVAVSLSNFNKWTKKRIPSHISLSQFSKVENSHDFKNVLLNILIIFFCLEKYFHILKLL